MNEALIHFIGAIDDPQAKNALEARLSVISTLYRQSNLNNLRILQQAIWDFERLYRALSEQHKAHEEAISVLLKLFLALSFELKAARIRPEDLKDRNTKMSLGMMLGEENDKKNYEPRSMRRIGATPKFRYTTPCYQMSCSQIFLVKGIVDADAIRNALDKSPRFVVRGQEPVLDVVGFA